MSKQPVSDTFSSRSGNKGPHRDELDAIKLKLSEIFREYGFAVQELQSEEAQTHSWMGF